MLPRLCCSFKLPLNLLQVLLVVVHSQEILDRNDNEDRSELVIRSQKMRHASLAATCWMAGNSNGGQYLLLFSLAGDQCKNPETVRCSADSHSPTYGTGGR